MASIVEIEHLTKRYGSLTAVDDLCLEIKEGEIFGLLGPNGAGKTTTILMLLGLTEPTEGTARISGLDPTRDALKVKRIVSYLPESVGFYEDITALANLRYTADLNGLKRDAATALIEESLAAVELEDRAEDKVGTYSRGMRQRLAIADILLKSPKVVFLDEPTLALDPDGVNHILDLIVRLNKERGMTVMLSSHQLEQVQRICDRIGIFVKGKLVTQGSIKDLGVKLSASSGLTIELGAQPADDKLCKILAQIDGVKKVERDHDLLLLHCDKDVRPVLASTVAEAGSALMHLRLQTVGLQEIYFRYFREN